MRILKDITVTLVLLLIVTPKTYAVMRVSVECPNEFIGTVEKVSEPRSPFHSLSKVGVKVKVQKKFKGKKLHKNFKALKFGNHKFKEGSTYKISMRDKWLCSVEEMSKEEVAALNF